MLKHSLLALGTAGFVAAASVVAAAPAAASSPSFSFSVYGSNYAFQFGNPYRYAHPLPKPRYVCTPTYKRIFYKHKGKTYSRLVQTGQSCRWVYPSPPKHGPYPYQYRPH